MAKREARMRNFGIADIFVVDMLFFKFFFISLV